MGSVRVGVTLATTDVLGTAVAINVANVISADSGQVLKSKVLSTTLDSTEAGNITLYKASDKTDNAYLYVRNLERDKENYVYVYNDTDSDAAVAKIAGGEFMFLPVNSAKTYRCYGTIVDQFVEYAVFGQDSSAVTLA